MNIILFNHYAGSAVHGMEYRPFYFARHWARAGHSVTIVAASFSHVRMRNLETDSPWTEEIIEGIRYVWLRTPTYKGNGLARVGNMLAFIAQAYRHSMRLVALKPDIVIASSTYPLDIYPARHIAKRTGAKLVFEVHDLWPLSPIELGGMPRWHPFIVAMQRAENDAYRLCDTAVSLLPKAEAHMVAHGLEPSKFAYIPNGIELREWESDRVSLSPENEALLSSFSEDGRFLVGYLGAHGIANALDNLILAAERLKDRKVSFLMVGHGPEKERLQALASERGLRHVHFIPPVPKQQVPSLLARLDALYIGLQRSSLFRFGVSPNKLLDYMASGRPVLNAIEAGNDLVQDSGCGLSVPAENPAALADGIVKLMGMSTEERARLGRNGSEYVRREHEYGVLASRFLAEVTGSIHQSRTA